MTTQIIRERNYKAGYVVRNKIAYTPDGLYIGPSRRGHFLCKKKGIKPELSAPDHNVCSIGFSEKEQKWYGWSHRAIFGFGIGSKTKKGDCSYMPANKADFLEDCVRFWDDEHHTETWTSEEYGEDGELGILTSWSYADSVPNKKLHGTIGDIFSPYPDEFGKGEWTAETLEDARQMAVDFAESVS